jgi:Cys-rich protein (TIGR01571 family)
MSYKPLVAAVAGATTAMFAGIPTPPGPPNWQTRHWSCLEDRGVCLQTCFCLWCTEAYIVAKRERGVPELEVPTCTFATCCDVLYPCCFTCSLALASRRGISRRYKIAEEPYCVSITYNICPLLNLCQVQREMALRSEHPGGLCSVPPDHGASIGQQTTAAATWGAIVANAHEWDSKLYHCANGNDCMDNTCLPCCTMAHMAQRLDAGMTSDIPRDVPNGYDGATCIGICCCFMQTAFAMRREVVERYVIVEPTVFSVVISMCCPCCAVAQARRQMGYEGEWPGGVLLKVAPPKL